MRHRGIFRMRRAVRKLAHRRRDVISVPATVRCNSEVLRGLQVAEQGRPLGRTAADEYRTAPLLLTANPLPLEG